LLTSSSKSSGGDDTITGGGEESQLLKEESSGTKKEESKGGDEADEEGDEGTEVGGAGKRGHACNHSSKSSSSLSTALSSAVLPSTMFHIPSTGLVESSDESTIGSCKTIVFIATRERVVSESAMLVEVAISYTKGVGEASFEKVAG
jgi:hypothetical protein